MTINKPPKVVGGLPGVTRSKDAGERWMRINDFLPALKPYLDLKIQRGQLSQHAEFRTVKMKKYEDLVKRVAAALKLWVPDMWKKDRPLVNLFGGTIASDEWFEMYYLLEKQGWVP